MIAWLKRLIYGESPEELFARCPSLKRYTDTEGHTHINTNLLMKNMKESGELDKWKRL